MNELTDDQIKSVILAIDPDEQYMPKALMQFARAVIAADRALREQAQRVPDDLIACLRGGRRCDEDGTEIIMSRQACCEAADILESLLAAPQAQPESNPGLTFDQWVKPWSFTPDEQHWTRLAWNAALANAQVQPERQPMIWTPFHQSLWAGQILPKEHKHILVQIAARPHKGMPPAVAVGYLRFAAGEKDSPTFTIPGVGGDVVAWCDCLPDDFYAPLWSKP